MKGDALRERASRGGPLPTSILATCERPRLTEYDEQGRPHPAGPEPYRRPLAARKRSEHEDVDNDLRAIDAAAWVAAFASLRAMAERGPAPGWCSDCRAIPCLIYDENYQQRRTT
jgi:hypothetical protein